MPAATGLTAFHGPPAVKAARFTGMDKPYRLAYLGRRSHDHAMVAKLPVGSRTTVPQGTWMGLTSGFGMGPGVSPPLWPSNRPLPPFILPLDIYRYAAGEPRVAHSSDRSPKKMFPRVRATTSPASIETMKGI